MLKVKKLKEGFQVVGHVDYNNVEAKVDANGKVSGKGSRKYKNEIIQAVEEYITPATIETTVEAPPTTEELRTIEEVEANTLQTVTTVDVFDKHGEYEGTHEVVTDGSEYGIIIDGELQFISPSYNKMILFAHECDKVIVKSNQLYSVSSFMDDQEIFTVRELMEVASHEFKCEFIQQVLFVESFTIDTEENDFTVFMMPPYSFEIDGIEYKNENEVFEVWNEWASENELSELREWIDSDSTLNNIAGKSLLKLNLL